MNIGIDARLWNETGVGRYIRALIANISHFDKRNKYTLFLRKKDFESKDIPQIFDRVLADIPWHSLEEQTVLPRLIDKANLDLVHIPYFSVPVFLKTPYVVTIHDLTLNDFATGKATTKMLPIYIAKQIAYRVVINSAIKNSQKIITVSHSVKNQILKKYHVPEDKVIVTYESGELEYRTKKNNPKVPARYILYVGNAHPHKNLLRLVDAFSLINKKNKQVKLVLIGGDDYFYKRLKSYVKTKNLDDYIVFTSKVPNNQLGFWYKRASCFVFPSLSEGFGIPGLEAMNMSCPIVVSDLEVFHEVYKDAALYFDPRTPHIIAQALNRLLESDKIRSNLIKNGEKVSKKYSWKRMAKETVNIYESCIGI